jgi:Flp pilus assembly protein TadG
MTQSKPFARGLLARLRAFRTDRRGIAATEFALLAPILICMYIMSMEVTQAVETNRKIGRAGNLVADLIAQQQNTSRTEVDAIMQIGASIMQPYNRSDLTIDVTAVALSDEPHPRATVAWSRKLENGAFGAGAGKGSAVTIPANLMVRDSFVVRVEAKLGYRPVLFYQTIDRNALGLAAAFDGIDMNERYYYMPRTFMPISCNNC